MILKNHRFFIEVKDEINSFKSVLMYFDTKKAARKKLKELKSEPGDGFSYKIIENRTY